MPLRIIACCLLLSALLFSCSSGEEDREEALKKEIMDVHDELMPKMDNIQTLKKQLEENKGYLSNDSASAVGDNSGQVEVERLIENLEEADESMMVWMRNYNAYDADTLTHEEQMEYLKQEREKIESVKLKMLSAIMDAQNTLEEKGIEQ